MPESLVSLADYGLVDAVIRPLMSGKEAQIYLVESQGEVRVAKVYREAEHRNFKHRSEYTEGRKTRNTRDQRALAKRSRYGREMDEAAWRAAEVDMIYRLNDAGVRVPRPYHFIDGVLIMELIKGADGEPAPRLGDLRLSDDEAARVYERLLAEVIRMLCAGVVHGDLSDFNVLMEPRGPVVIDFPQSVDASANTGARKLLVRDVENLHRFLQRFVPSARPRPYAQEMWELYQRGELTPDTRLRGHFKASQAKVDTGDVLDLVREAYADAHTRGRPAARDNDGTPAHAARPEPGVRPRRVEVVISRPSPGRPGRKERGKERDPGGARQEHGVQGRTAGGRSGQARGGQARGGQARGGQARGGQARGGRGPEDQDSQAEAREATDHGGTQRGDRERSSPGRGGAHKHGGAPGPKRDDGKARSGRGTPFVGQPRADQTVAPQRDQADGAAPKRKRRRRRRKPRKPEEVSGQTTSAGDAGGAGGARKPLPQAQRSPPAKVHPDADGAGPTRKRSGPRSPRPQP